jgi:hypothetical protein
MAYDPLANFVYGVVAIVPSPAASGTTLSLTNAAATIFPDPASVGAYNVTIWPTAVQPLSSNAEIVRITAKGADDSGGAGYVEFTITRTQESSSARTILVGDQIAATITKKTLLDIQQGLGFNAPQGFLINGKIVPSVASNNLTVAIKGLDGNDPSASNPVYCRIGDTVRTITAALSVTKNAGTNYFNAGGAELATKEIDYFVYLGYNATDGVVVGFSRIPYATRYDIWDTTSTHQRYCAISTITNAAVGDYYELIGRFAATLSAGAGYTWTVPTFTANNLIQRPIYETRWLTWAPAFSGWSSSPTVNWARYMISINKMSLRIDIAATTSNNAAHTFTIPYTVSNYPLAICSASDNGAILTTPAKIGGTPDSATLTLYKDWANAAWTASGTSSFSLDSVSLEIY